MCASLVPRPNAVIYGLRTRLCVQYKITKWHPTQRTAAEVCLVAWDGQLRRHYASGGFAEV